MCYNSLLYTMTYKYIVLALCDTLVLGCHRVLKSWKSVGKKGCPCSNPMLEYQ
jgi:hypothetical protein